MADGITTAISPHTVDETLRRIRAFLEAHAITIFAIVDHSGEAAKVGLALRPTKVVIFGNPKAGTPLMLASPSAALDLPLKILVWEKTDGTVALAYNDSAYLQHRHALPGALMGNIAVVDTLAAKAGE